MPDQFDDHHDLDGNGCPIQWTRIGDQDVVIHYDDIPESDITTVRGIRCTTPLRTLIDVAPDMELDELADLAAEWVGRGLFTLAEARARLADADMRGRPGAARLRRALPDV